MIFFCRQHTENGGTDLKQNIDANKTVENIVDDILSVEDDYMTMSTNHEILNNFNHNQTYSNENTDDNLMQIEFLKEMNQLHSLDDEFLYNDLDFDTLQNNQIFNMNTTDMDYSTNGEMFDYTIGSKSMDQDIMNALVKNDSLPDDLFNLNTFTEKPALPSHMPDECATIFESDVDLEASTNLAANLNQLICENTVQYISTEDDDTFIISLNSEIDAAKLQDMLNSDVELVKSKEESDTQLKKEEFSLENDKSLLNNIVPVIIKVEQHKSWTHESTDKRHMKTLNNVPVLMKTEEQNKICKEININDVVTINYKNSFNNKVSIKTEDDNNQFKLINQITSKGDQNIRKENRKSQNKKPVEFICKTCNKVFNRKENYKSHIGQ